METLLCPSCKKEISAILDKCPSCGQLFPPDKKEQYIMALKRKKQLGCFFGILLFLLVILVYFINEPSKSPTETRSTLIQHAFNPWDGSHIKLVKLIKENMHNPSSFEHVKTVYRDDSSTVYVRMTYRGSNMYGGVVLNWVEAKATPEGDIISILATGLGN